MKIERDSLGVLEFEGLFIRDFTRGMDLSSSVAEIEVPPGAQHPFASSRRSDKYYHVLAGTLAFTVGELDMTVRKGDVCVVPRGTRFAYRNSEESAARVILIHTPSFRMEEEVFEDGP